MRWAGFDVETGGVQKQYALQPFRALSGDAWLTSAAYGVAPINWDGSDHDAPMVLSELKPSRENLADFLQYAIDNKLTVVGWNTPFDVAWLIALGLGDLALRVKWLDGMLLARHTRCCPTFEVTKDTPGYGLKVAVEMVFPQYAGYGKDIDFDPASDAGKTQLLQYNERDVRYSMAVAKHYWDQLTDKQKRVALVEAACIPLVAQTLVQGVCSNITEARQLSSDLSDDATNALITLKLSDPDITEEVLRSPKKLGEWILKRWNLPPVKLTGTGTMSTDRESLAELALLDPRAALVNTYRESTNNKTKFADGTVESLLYNGDGRVRPAHRMYGTYTGRMTISSTQGRGKDEVQTGIALHQWKREARFRKLLKAPEGYTLCEFDFAGQEFRWMAELSGDLVMKRLCQPGEDAHSYMAAQIVGSDYKTFLHDLHAKVPGIKEQRQLGKVANLCVAGSTQVLTDRGFCSIVDVRKDDLVWDGMEFVSHDGVVCSGVREVISYAGLTATPEHKVLVDNEWKTLEETARHGWRIEPALGKGWQGACRSAVRIMGGVGCRAARKMRGSICALSMCMRSRERCEPCNDGGRTFSAVQGMRYAYATPSRWRLNHHKRRRPSATAPRQCGSFQMPQFRRPELPQLRWSRDRVSVQIREALRAVREAVAATSDISAAGYRPRGQRGALRGWKLAFGYEAGEPHEPSPQKVYDIVNCGPRTRFAANGLIVHNSLQYRTSAPTLAKVAAIQHGIKMGLDQAKLIHATYQRSYPAVPLYWKAQQHWVKNNTWIENLAGRRVWLRPLHERTSSDRWAYDSTAVNYPIQSMGAEQKYLALLYLVRELPKFYGFFYYELHDGLYTIIPNDLVADAVPVLKHGLSNLPYKKAFGLNLSVPFPVDCKVGPSWGELSEWPS